MEQDELRRLEDRCIQEHAPACSAACPLHVDVRAMTAETTRGDFAAAAGIFKKTVPFPGIISRVCDHPCQAVCKRREAGDAVSIRALERACLERSSGLEDRIQVLPRKDRRAAIVGGGLSGLTAAFDLGRKGYAAVVFERENRLGGSLRRFSGEELPLRTAADDFLILKEVGVEIRLGTTVGKDIDFGELCAGFETVYLGLGENPPDSFALAVDRKGNVDVDPATFSTSRAGVFAGGGMLRRDTNRSPIQSMADGRRAAISMDRYFQQVSLTAGRTGEGSYTTRLYTVTEGIVPLPVVPMADARQGYSADEAVQEAARCIQCECLECVKVCEYLKSFGSYPRQYVRQIYNNLAIVMGHRHANKLINSCSLCGLCREVCPGDLHMGLVCGKARQTLVRQGRMPPSAHDFPIRDMLFSNSDKCALVRRQPGVVTSRFLFFPGCQLTASYPEQVKRVYSLLRDKLAGGVGLMLRCCGAPADWSGREELFREVMESFTESWRDMGSPELILACSTCFETFKSRLPGTAVSSLWEILDRLGLPQTGRPGESPAVAVHDACSTRHEPFIHESVRNILGRLGMRVEELPLTRDRTECCGYGGLMFFANAELAGKVIERRNARSSLDYVAYCAMCRDYLAKRGKRVAHLLDLVLGASMEEAVGRGVPVYSQRHENRARLKTSLLAELWGEETPERESSEKIALSVSDRMRDIMEERLILVEDVLQVIEYAERTGNRLLNRETGHTLAHHRPASVTYWVEYSAEGDRFVIHNAYSHRMEVAEEPRS